MIHLRLATHEYRTLVIDPDQIESIVTADTYDIANAIIVTKAGQKHAVIETPNQIESQMGNVLTN